MSRIYPLILLLALLIAPTVFAQTNVGGALKSDTCYVNIGGTLKQAHRYVNVGGVMKDAEPSAGTNIELGHATSASTSASLNSRMIPFTVPAGGMTASHVYAYVAQSGGNPATIAFSIYTSAKVLVVSDCAQTFNVPNTAAWTGGALTTPTYLAAGDYFLQYKPNNTTIIHYAETGCTGCATTSSSCSVASPTASSNWARAVVANYASR